MNVVKDAKRLEGARDEAREVFTRAAMRAGWILEAYGLLWMNVEEIDVDVTMHTGTVGGVVDAYLNLFPPDVHKTSVQPGTPRWAHMQTHYGRVFCQAINKQGWIPVAIKMGSQFDAHGRIFLSAFILNDSIAAKALMNVLKKMEKALQKKLKDKPPSQSVGGPCLVLVTNPDPK